MDCRIHLIMPLKNQKRMKKWKHMVSRFSLNRWRYSMWLEPPWIGKKVSWHRNLPLQIPIPKENVAVENHSMCKKVDGRMRQESLLCCFDNIEKEETFFIFEPCIIA